MEGLTNRWNIYKADKNIDDIAKSLRQVKNKIVWTIPYTKQDWFNLPNHERLNCQLHHPMEIKQCNEVMKEIKKKAGYIK